MLCCRKGEPWFRADDNAAILHYNDKKKVLANHVGNDEKGIGTFLDHKARVDLKSPWTIIKKIQYKSMNQVFMH